MWALVGVPLDYAPHVIVERVQVRGVRRTEFGREWLAGWRSSTLESPWPCGRKKCNGNETVGGCRVLLDDIGPSLGHSVDPGLHDVTENLHMLFGIHPKSFLKVWRHDVSLVGDDAENHDGGWELCVHDVGTSAGS